MGDSLRLAVGVIGTAATILLYGAPILTFAKIIRKRSTGDFSCIPYVLTLLTSLTYCWYGLPVVSHRWKNIIIVTVNGLGILLESSFILIYFWFASAKGRMKVSVTTMTAIIVFCITATVSAFVLHDHHHRKLLVGSIGVVTAVAMYGSPLVVMKQVIETKSVEFMPFYLSFSNFLSSSIWLAYGVISHDPFIMTPNTVGLPLSILQLALYCKYREEPDKCDLEKNEEKSQDLQVIRTCIRV